MERKSVFGVVQRGACAWVTRHSHTRVANSNNLLPNLVPLLVFQGLHYDVVSGPSGKACQGGTSRGPRNSELQSLAHPKWGRNVILRNWRDSFPILLSTTCTMSVKQRKTKKEGINVPDQPVERNGTWVRGHLFNLPNFPVKNLPYVLHSYQEPSVIQQPPVHPIVTAGLCKPTGLPRPCPFHIKRGHCAVWEIDSYLQGGTWPRHGVLKAFGQILKLTFLSS